MVTKGRKKAVHMRRRGKIPQIPQNAVVNSWNRPNVILEHTSMTKERKKRKSNAAAFFLFPQTDTKLLHTLF